MIWQLAKIYAKLKKRLSPRVCYLDLAKREKKAHKNTTFAVGPLNLFGRLQMGPWPEFRGGADMAGQNSVARGPAAREDRGKGFTEARGTDFGVELGRRRVGKGSSTASWRTAAAMADRDSVSLRASPAVWQIELPSLIF